ncbi:MAG: c-type cytochrome [Verrucomicrobiota bacterium]
MTTGWFLVWVGVLVSPGGVDAQVQVAAETRFRELCATCHGAEGHGNQALLAPNLAGLPSWYVEEQLLRFRNGWRGTGDGDHSGATMRAVALTLADEEISGLAKHVASLPVYVPEAEAPEEFAQMHELYRESCASCHRFNGQGEVVFSAAPLSTFPSWYLADALRKYRDGVRGSHPKDPKGQQMQEIVEPYSDETIFDLARYIGMLGEAYPPGKRRAVGFGR